MDDELDVSFIPLYFERCIMDARMMSSRLGTERFIPEKEYQNV